MDSSTQTRWPVRPIALGTLSFALCFALWGLMSAFAPRFRQQFHLSATEASFVIAVPVLLGALARLPIGMLSDRFGARRVATLLMAFIALPAALVPLAPSYSLLLVTAFFLGMAGSFFSVGVDYVSRWTSPKQQGTALGIYGAGNIGQSAAVFLAPLLATQIGLPWVFRSFAIAALLWAVLYWILARDAPRSGPPKRFSAMVQVLSKERLSWALSAFYFVTFGGFVAFSIYLPSLLRDEFRLAESDAGLRTAGFVVLATLMRPVGGWLSDRIGGTPVLNLVFWGIVPFTLLLAWPQMVPFTVGALGCAALLGLGNGAVFKLVPQYFPQQTGTVTGLVGALGGLGGFFPPLLMGFCRDRFHTVWPGFALLALTAASMAVLNRQVFGKRTAQDQGLWSSGGPIADRIRAGVVASLVTALLVAAIVVGSRNLEHFDAALVVYTFAVIFATWGVTYHYRVWIQKPPTRLFWRRGFALVRQQGVIQSALMLSKLAVTHIFAQTFIRNRSRLRWWMHQFLFWGCLLAAAVTFPLVFGWIHFETLPTDQLTYVTYVFGFPTMSFPLGTVQAWLIFHALDIAAVLVLAGIALALWRRMRDEGARALQDLSRDFAPLVLLFAISVTGLALTVSTAFLRGAFFGFLSILHAATVIGALLYLPFGKFFHIFQRPAQLGVKLYDKVGEKDPGAICPRCKLRFASQMQLADVKSILPELGFNYAFAQPLSAWQDLCPQCKRTSLARAQLRIKEDIHG